MIESLDGTELLGSATLKTSNLLVPRTFALYPNRPNPFNPVTTIDFDVAAPVYASIRVYDVAGRLIRTLWDQSTAEGYYSVKWDGVNNNGSPVASGVYFYQLRAGSFVSTRKLVLLK